MHSRALRLVLLVVWVIGVAAAAGFIRSSEKNLNVRRAALRDFDGRAREATEALADIRAAQQAYVALGQGTGFWMPKVDATTQTVASALTTLRQAATTAGSTTALDEALTTFAEFGRVDGRIRSYLKSNAQLMAADIVFTEGGETAASAARHVERARLEERVALDQFEADIRKQELTTAGGAAGLALLVMAILALASSTSAAQSDAPSLSTSLHQFTRDPQPAGPTPQSEHDPQLRHDATEVKPQDGATRHAESSKSAAAFRTAAQICTDIGRVGDPEELRGLLARAADVLDASGLLLWLGTASGAELRPVVAHGYSAEMVARIPPVARSANNAAAAAYRSGALQIVLSRPGSPVKGAIVAPVLAVSGCVGVLSAEIRDGGEASDTAQALAAIFAAQLAGVVAPTPDVAEQRATGSG